MTTADNDVTVEFEPNCDDTHRRSQDEHNDHVDAIPEQMSFTWLDALAILFSIGSFMFDIGTDVAVCIIQFITNHMWYFGLTTAFVVIPTLIMTCISMRWYVLDSREDGSPTITKLQWTMRFICLMIQMGPILRYYDSLIYGLKFRQHSNDKEAQRRYYQYMVYEDTDATMLRLFECFMEAAPQLVLQMYITFRTLSDNENANDHWMITAQGVSVFASLVSLSWSLVSYHRALRLSLPDKVNMTWKGIAIQFIWRWFMIAARVLALGLFASEYRFYIAIVCGIHWLIMFIWIITMRTTFCDNRCEELGYNAVLAVMFIFCYFNPVDSPTRNRYLFYYIFMFIENTILLAFWYNSCAANVIYRMPAVYAHYSLFFIGLSFMMIYYLKFHPRGDIRLNRREGIGDELHKPSRPLNGYKRQIFSGLWTTQGRLLHPRPTVPTSILTDNKTKEICKRNIKNTIERNGTSGSPV